MTALAPTLQAFFTDRLTHQLGASAHTIAAYRDAWRLLLAFAAARTGVAPTKLDIVDLDATLIGEFLNYLEVERDNSIRTRNGRLAAIHSTFTFAALRHPEHAETIARVLAIPPNRYDRNQVTYLTRPEVSAVLGAPDHSTWTGRRDRAWILLAVTAGLRVSELTALTRGDLNLDTGAHVLCHGKGRKDRTTPVTTEAVAVLRAWSKELPPRNHDSAVPDPDRAPDEPRRSGCPAESLHPDRDQRMSVAVGKAGHPHVLRHTAAMRLLDAGVDVMTIALWLGHASSETTQIYLHADLALKERAIARTTPTGTRPGRYQPGDRLLAFLEAL